jgi:hypothetical protein
MNRQKSHRATSRVRLAGWLGVIAMLALAILGPGAGSTFAAGPGNNGLDPTGNGTTSDATVDGSLSAAGGSATMDNSQTASTLSCNGLSATSAGGRFTLTKDLDVGSKITVYLVPNNGSNADPAANVSKNETTITLGAGNHTSGSVINWTITITHSFTVSSGGILGVFAVNADNETAISSSKTFSLNCTEAQPTPTPTTAPTATPTTAPTATPTTAPTATPTTAPTATPTTAPTATPTTAPTATPTTAPTPTATAVEATPTPTGEVQAATGTPRARVTLPPTDALSGEQTQGSGSWRIALIAIAGLLAGILVLTPSRRRR